MKSITLHYREGSSDKVYQASIEPKGNQFVVNFAYGRRGTTLQTGSKTQAPVDLEEAQAVFTKLINSKKAKGYTETENGTPYHQTGQEGRVSGFLPQLLNPIDEEHAQSLLKDAQWCMQEKFDGRRTLLVKRRGEVTGVNRKGLTVGLPASIVESAMTMPCDFVMDGESIGETFHAFDLLTLDIEDCRQLPYRQRLTSLMHLLTSKSAHCIRLVGTACETMEKELLMRTLRELKKEGVVFKRLDAPYTPGRPNSAGSQLKHKFYATLSAVVARINPQRSVELKLLNGEGWQSAGNVTIPSNQPVPKVGEVVEVRYLYALRASGCLYQPVCLGERQDIGQHECVLSQIKYKADDEG